MIKKGMMEYMEERNKRRNDGKMGHPNSSVPMFQCSNIPVFHVLVFHYSRFPIFHHSNVPIISIPMFQFSNIPLFPEVYGIVDKR